jgi:hypothetical protein
MTTYTLATTQPVFWAVKQGAVIIAAGTTPTNAITFAADTNTMISDVSENAFLGKAVGAAGSYKPLPATGTPLLTGEIYGYSGGLVMVRQSHNRTTDAPATVPALFSAYQSGGPGVLAWVQAEAVLVGTQRTYGGKTYVCLQAHQTEFTPNLVPALWSELITVPTGTWGYPVTYAVGVRVAYNGTDYDCILAHVSNVGWTPDITPTLWAVVAAVGAWAFPVAYTVGQRVTYLGLTYECRQAHTSQAGWFPSAVPALWLAV